MRVSGWDICVEMGEDSWGRRGEVSGGRISEERSAGGWRGEVSEGR